MSSQAATLPYPPNTKHQMSSIAVSRMMLDDIPVVLEIETASFPRSWPEKAYRYELTENTNAYFVVARTHGYSDPAKASTSALRRLFSRIRPMTAAGPDTGPAIRRPLDHAWLRPHGLAPWRATLRGPLSKDHLLGHTSNYQVPTSMIVGFAGMWMYVDEAHIATIATRADWRGRGVGETILHNLMREAQRRNAVSATLEVRIGNVVAQSLYRKYGFEEVGRRKNYYQDNREDALLMTVTNFETNVYRARLDELERSLREHAMR